MQLGICTGLENIKLVEEAGFAYIEPAVQTIAGLAEAEFVKMRDLVQASAIKAEAFNIFLPADLKVVGPEVDLEKITDYVKAALTRISQLGAEVIVFGSGGARRVPDGFSKEAAFAQLVTFLRQVSDLLLPYDIVVAIEPLPLRSCNIVNDVLEGLELARAVDRANIRLLADYWHMLYHDEDLQNIVQAQDYIQHIHINNPEGGKFPKLTDPTDYRELIKPLQQIGYQGRISIEAITDDLKKDMAEAMQLWRSIF